LLAVFRETDPLRVNLEVFGHLAACLGAPPKELSLSLPRVFENRRFEVLSFGDEEIETLLDLRSEAFYGFYLSHNSEQNVLLVYAGQGRHLEFGRNRCLVQASATSEPSEFKGPALLGLAQNAEGHFVFVVQPTYREWVKSYERFCHEVYAHFATLPELSAKLTDYTLIWPELAAAEGEADASESAR
jgi:hypothetical protein